MPKKLSISERYPNYHHQALNVFPADWNVLEFCVIRKSRRSSQQLFLHCINMRNVLKNFNFAPVPPPQPSANTGRCYNPFLLPLSGSSGLPVSVDKWMLSGAISANTTWKCGFFSLKNILSTTCRTSENEDSWSTVVRSEIQNIYM